MKILHQFIVSRLKLSLALGSSSKETPFDCGMYKELAKKNTVKKVAKILVFFIIIMFTPFLNAKKKINDNKIMF